MLAAAIRDVKSLDRRQFEGRVTGVEGLRIEVAGPKEALQLGALARFDGPDGPRGELVGFRNQQAILLAADPVEGLSPGAPVVFSTRPDFVRPSSGWLGRVVDAFGEPLDDKGPVREGHRPRPIRALAPNPQSRARVNEPMGLGVRAMDVFAPCAQGQRIGIFAGSGVGKSTLLSMLARNVEADVVVIGLIGERGREVREFVEDTLGEEGLKRAVIVAATSDEPAPRRRRAAWLTMALAEHFRDEGKKVACFLDSVTRFAMAQREIGLAAGEPPTTRGYTPSVFTELPKLLERAGPGRAVGPGEAQGHVTGLFTVLVDGDDHNEPISDAVRAILDGHVTLSRHIAERGRFPAVDVLKSISRLNNILLSREQSALAARARRLLSVYSDMEELVRIGAYSRGADAEVDEAVRLWPLIEGFLAQDATAHISPAEAFAQLEQIVTSGAGAGAAQGAPAGQAALARRA